MKRSPMILKHGLALTLLMSAGLACSAKPPAEFGEIDTATPATETSAAEITWTDAKSDDTVIYTAAPGTAAVSPAVEEAKRGNWSRWRGPTGDGLSAETGLLKTWPEDGPPLLWKSKGFGGGYASVAIANGRIFTMGKKDGQNCIVAAKLDDGTVLWTTPIGGGNDPNCTPTVDGNMVYALGLDGDLACVEAATGKPVWRVNYGKDLGGKMMSGWGYSESPLIDGNLVICTPGGDKALLAALNKKTGKLAWTTPVTGSLGDKGGDGAGYASIVISNAAGVKQYVTLVGRGVIGVNAKTGQLLWHYGGVANGTANCSTPLVSGDYVFASSGYGTGSALLKISRKGNQLVADEQYFLDADKMQNHHGGMILKDGFVYCGHGHNNGFPLCIDMQTGEEKWRPGRGAGAESAAVAYADGQLYFRYQDGTMALIEATPEKYILNGKFKIAINNGASWPHPVIAGGKLYLRDQDEMVCYDLRQQ